MRKLTIQSLIIAALLFLAVGIYGQHMEELYSPTFLGGGTSAVSSESPMADIYNPATSGADQRITVDLSYIHLIGLGTETGNGGAFNIGLGIPKPYGVFAMSGHFLTAAFTNRNFGTLGELNFSFSKDLYPNLLIGGGLDLIVGAQAGAWDFGLGLDLGFVHLVGDLGFLKDMAWGVALRDLGKGYDPTNDYHLFPRPVTLAAGAAFKVLKHNIIDITIMPDIIATPFLNFQANIGAEIGLWKHFYIRTAYNLDVQELLNNNISRFPVTFGLTYKTNAIIKEDIQFLDISKRGWDRSDLSVNAVAGPLVNNIWAFGAGANIALGVKDATPPVITLAVSEDQDVYISPNLDGTNDDLILPLGITDTRYIKGYKVIIRDKNDTEVRTIVNKDERPEDTSFKNLWQRATYTKTGISIPESVRWDGKSDQGTVVEDGEYNYSVEAWDDNGNTAITPKRKVFIDTVAPNAELTTSYTIFSPNDDGNKDTLPIEQKGSLEDKWEAIIKNNNGDEVRNILWENSAPDSFSWDGKNNSGILVPDGIYTYNLKSTDRAGNVQTYKLENIIINTAATPININIGLADISPNGDGIKDMIRFNMDIPVTTGIETWSMNVVDTTGKVVKQFTGTESIEPYIDFNGKNDSGTTLAEGTYKGQLELLYSNGNNPKAVSPDFIIDLTKPSAFVKANLSIFSPNNDGNKDSVIITQDSSEEVLWKGILKNSTGDLIRTFSWKGTADSRLEWDGTDESGKLMGDDLYSYYLEATDKAGNLGKSGEIKFQLNTEETPVLLSMNYKFFSPNRDGEKDIITLTPVLKVKTGIDSYIMNIKATNNTIVRSYEGRNSIPETFQWDGTDISKNSVPDGEYFAELNIKYKNGNEPFAKTIPFTIDTVYPEITLNSNYLLFSPDGDGKLDTITFIQNSGSEDLWDAEVLDSSNNTIKAVYWKGQVENFTWNGKDDNGNTLADGLYAYKVYSTDKAGNKTEKIIKDIEIDSRQTTVFVTASTNAFSPNNDGYFDLVTYTNYVSLEQGIKSWKLEIENNLGATVKVFSGGNTVDQKIVWDGKNEAGAIVDGTYTATLKVEYHKGNTPSERANPVILDTTKPELSLSISPDLFSPDNDGYNDELTIKPTIVEATSIQQWKLEILDPMGKHFTTFAGKGIPANEIRWNGISDKGELVQAAEDYTIVFEAIDELGNASKLESKIPVDILVIRVGDKLKIRIASITFAPNTADYMAVDADKLERNLKTIKRLAEIFQKYNKYNILIEGHAVSLNWNNPTAAAKEQTEELIPLSKQRADSIKNALVKEGLDPTRITTEGIGGSQPVVPHSDTENRWKNRRVEFILIRK